MTQRLLRLKDVIDRTGLSRSTIYDLIKKGKFPHQVMLTERAVGWDEDAIHDWILARLEAAHKRHSSEPGNASAVG